MNNKKDNEIIKKLKSVVEPENKEHCIPEHGIQLDHKGLLDQLLFPKTQSEIKTCKAFICHLLATIAIDNAPISDTTLLTMKNISIVDDMDWYHFMLFWIMMTHASTFNFIYRRTDTKRLHRFLPILHVHCHKLMYGYQSELDNYDKSLFTSKEELDKIENNPCISPPKTHIYTPREFVWKLREIYINYC